MKKKYFSKADQLVSEAPRSEFESRFENNSIVNKRRLEQLENRRW